MLLAINQHAVEVNSWEDKSALLSFLKKHKTPTIILGAEADQELEFFSAIVHVDYAARSPVRKGQSSNTSWGIAIISEGQGVKPQLVGLPGDLLVFGLNHQIVALSIVGGTEVFRYSFDSLFHAFIYSPKERILIVRNEIGVVALTESGNEMWRFDRDVITDCTISHETSWIELTFMDSAPVTLDLVTGHTIG
jgi:hypothetical protein